MCGYECAWASEHLFKSYFLWFGFSNSITKMLNNLKQMLSTCAFVPPNFQHSQYLPCPQSAATGHIGYTGYFTFLKKLLPVKLDPTNQVYCHQVAVDSLFRLI